MWLRLKTACATEMFCWLKRRRVKPPYRSGAAAAVVPWLCPSGWAIPSVHAARHMGVVRGGALRDWIMPRRRGRGRGGGLASEHQTQLRVCYAGGD